VEEQRIEPAHDFRIVYRKPTFKGEVKEMQESAELFYPAAERHSHREILTPAQVAERLHVKPSWVYEQTRERADVRNLDPLPFIKMGRYLRFDWPDVEAWLDRQKRG
jgi:predicted DNA-binding transcriptional regulator AlpA